MSDTIRERIKDPEYQIDDEAQILAEWAADNLIPRDEYEAAIKEAIQGARQIAHEEITKLEQRHEAAVAEAVRAERLRVEGLCQALRYRMNVADFNDLIAAIRDSARTEAGEEG